MEDYSVGGCQRPRACASRANFSIRKTSLGKFAVCVRFYAHWHGNKRFLISRFTSTTTISGRRSATDKRNEKRLDDANKKSWTNKFREPRLPGNVVRALVRLALIPSTDRDALTRLYNRVVLDKRLGTKRTLKRFSTPSHFRYKRGSFLSPSASGRGAALASACGAAERIITHRRP